jgi:SAM-dependent methyltransferase
MKKLKHTIRRIPILGPTLAYLFVWISELRFRGSANYWDERYQAGGDSGDGSYGELSKFKANVLNDLVDSHNIQTVIELGCGDGNQLQLARYPKYLGLDVSQKALDICKEMFGSDPDKSFQLMENYAGERADVALSLDVIYHLVEDDVFNDYMGILFGAAQRMVVIYASNTDVQDTPQPPHVCHRRFTDWIEINAPDWTLSQVVENEFPYDQASGEGSAADFFIFKRHAG